MVLDLHISTIQRIKHVPLSLWHGERREKALSTKGKKEGTGGHVANFLVAICYEKGVVCCERYYGNITGELFSDFVHEHFPVMFEKSANPKYLIKNR